MSTIPTTSSHAIEYKVEVIGGNYDNQNLLRSTLTAAGKQGWEHYLTETRNHGGGLRAYLYFRRPFVEPLVVPLVVPPNEIPIQKLQAISNFALAFGTSTDEVIDYWRGSLFNDVEAQSYKDRLEGYIIKADP